MNEHTKGLYYFYLTNKYPFDYMKNLSARVISLRAMMNANECGWFIKENQEFEVEKSYLIKRGLKTNKKPRRSGARIK